MENGKSPQPILCWSLRADVLCNPQEVIFSALLRVGKVLAGAVCLPWGCAFDDR